MKILFVLLAGSFTICFSQTNSLQYYFNAAREAHKAGDHKKFYELIQEAHKLHPYHQGILYQSGIAAALNNKPAEAVDYLNRAVQINTSFDLNVADLKSLENDSDFIKLRKRQLEWQEPIIHSDTAFTLKDRMLHIECIALGESINVFYLGSVHKRKIVRVDENSTVTDFTTQGQDGLTSVFGVKVDPSNKVLWACSSPGAEMEPADSTAMSAVFKYDIKTKKLLTKYSPLEKKEYIFGDLTLNKKGEVFISDSKNNIVFKVNEEKKLLEPYFTSDEFWNLQGISFSEDGKYLFIADYVKGLFRLDTQDKKLISLNSTLPVSLKSVDGLTYYNNSLITLQNLITPMRVTQFMLNKSKDAFTGYKIIDRAHPAFNEPTIGCAVGNTFYYVANSQWSGYDEKRKIKPADQLQDIVILKADLNKLE